MSLIRATCSTHVFLLNLVTLIIFEEYRLWSFSLYNFLHLPGTSEFRMFLAPWPETSSITVLLSGWQTKFDTHMKQNMPYKIDVKMKYTSTPLRGTMVSCCKANGWEEITDSKGMRRIPCHFSLLSLRSSTWRWLLSKSSQHNVGCKMLLMSSFKTLSY